MAQQIWLSGQFTNKSGLYTKTGKTGKNKETETERERGVSLDK